MIDLLFAAIKVASAPPDLAAALALLLDLAKAYDTLNCNFLIAALRFLSFPDRFVRFVELLHWNTTCMFLINGFASLHLEVTCVICQGCPLASLLLILALETLYR